MLELAEFLQNCFDRAADIGPDLKNTDEFVPENKKEKPVQDNKDEPKIDLDDL